MNPYGILLAAGQSTRLGRPKQLVRAGGITLIERAASNFRRAFPHARLVVVLGAFKEEIKPVLENKISNLVILENSLWENGLSESLKTASLYFRNQRADQDSAFILTVCDQYLLTPRHLEKLYRRFSESGRDTLTGYGNGCCGVPACVKGETLFKSDRLRGDAGLKKLLNEKERIEIIENPDLLFDVDTPRDLEGFERYFREF